MVKSQFFSFTEKLQDPNIDFAPESLALKFRPKVYGRYISVPSI